MAHTHWQGDAQSRSPARSISLGFLFVTLGLGLASCSQVPRESVELSATVGRDLQEVHRAHRELAVTLFQRMKSDVNHFVDEVYAPFQINRLLTADQEDFRKGDPISLFFVLNEAVRMPDDPDAQRDALDFMEVFVSAVRDSVESYRTQRLAPIVEQEREVLESIDRSYKQILYANSVVTGHLASVRKVRDAQSEILRVAGLEDLRVQIGEGLASTSQKLAEFVGKARGAATTVSKVDSLTSGLDAILKPGI